MKNTYIEGKWAVIFFITVLLWTAFERSLGWHGEDVDKQEFYTVLFNIPMILIFFFSIQEKRKKYYKGYMSWWQGFLSGMILGIMIVALTPLSHFIMYKYISPYFFTAAIEYSVTSKKMSLEGAQSYYSLKNFIIQTMTAVPWIAAATSALLAIILQRKRPVLEK